MSIFSKISEMVLGTAASPQAPAAAPADAGAQAAAPGGATPWWQAAATAAQANPTDVEAALETRAQAHGERLNWRTSIVDLMKLLGIDSSLENRKELARELGYTGDTGDSATMNVWLHRQVMRELAANGGQVPAALTD